MNAKRNIASTLTQPHHAGSDTIERNSAVSSTACSIIIKMPNDENMISVKQHFA